MHSHHVHLPLHHIRPQRLGRDLVIASAIALVAIFAVVGGRAMHATSQNAEPEATAKTTATAPAPLKVEIRNGTGGVVATVRGLETDATNAVRIVDNHGVVITGALLDHDGVRFDNLLGGVYRVEVSSEGPIVEANGALISSAVMVRSEPFTLAAPGAISVQPA